MIMEWFVVVALLVICYFLGYLRGEAVATKAIEKQWSDAVRREAWPRYPLKMQLPLSAQHDHDWDQPGGKCSSCGAPLNDSRLGGYRLHQPHLHGRRFEPGLVKGPNEEWMR